MRLRGESELSRGVHFLPRRVDQMEILQRFCNEGGLLKVLVIPFLPIARAVKFLHVFYCCEPELALGRLDDGVEIFRGSMGFTPNTTCLPPTVLRELLRLGRNFPQRARHHLCSHAIQTLDMPEQRCVQSWHHVVSRETVCLEHQQNDITMSFVNSSTLVNQQIQDAEHGSSSVRIRLAQRTRTVGARSAACS